MEGNMDCILATNGVTKRYGNRNVVNTVSINVCKGDIYGLIGKNGAGKTTLLKMICGHSTLDAGEISLFGKAGKEAAEFLPKIGSLIERPGIYPAMSAEDNLKMKCLASGINQPEIINQILSIVGLGEVGKKPVGIFSMGMKQRLGIAMALTGYPELVILDEPINGLDPGGIAEVREVIRSLNQKLGITFVISSHILEELSKISNRYGIIENGVLLREMTTQEISMAGRTRIELKTNDIQKASTILQSAGLKSLNVTEEGVIQIFDRVIDSGDITMTLSLGGIKVREIIVKTDTLEDYFLQLTEKSQ